jgi:hypothetical protein
MTCAAAFSTPSTSWTTAQIRYPRDGPGGARNSPLVRSGARCRVDGILPYADVESPELIEVRGAAVSIVDANGNQAAHTTDRALRTG